MNHPDRFEKFVLLPDQKKVTIKRDTKVKNAAQFVVEKEDHTIGNLVRYQLFLDNEVSFSGYRIPHPLENRMVVRCQTVGQKTVEEAFDNALEDLETEFTNLRKAFQDEVDKEKRNTQAADSTFGYGMSMPPR